MTRLQDIKALRPINDTPKERLAHNRRQQVLLAFLAEEAAEKLSPGFRDFSQQLWEEEQQLLHQTEPEA